jgi:hypothetical protein
MSGGTLCEGADWSTRGLVYLGRPKCHRTIATPNQPKLANEFRRDRMTQEAPPTVDGLDATAEALRRAAENTPSGAAPDDVENVPVFDRVGLI